jgi:acyl-CoA reductase-like NAD-dependent aldehyde dehydrogenase
MQLYNRKAIANDSRFGLCASMWTKDIRLGLVMTKQVKVGTVWLRQHLSIVFECRGADAMSPALTKKMRSWFSTNTA